MIFINEAQEGLFNLSFNPRAAFFSTETKFITLINGFLQGVRLIEIRMYGVKNDTTILQTPNNIDCGIVSIVFF